MGADGAAISMQSANSARWKKLGSILKSKSTGSQLQKVKGLQKFGVPLRRMPGRHPNQAAEKISSTSTAPEAPDLDDCSMSVLSFQSATLETSAKLDELPKIEIEIPPAELGRYSVVFRDVSGIYLTSLMPEESRNMSNLRTIKVPLEPPHLLDESPQRIMKPSRLPELYSLFPIPPTSQINLSQSLVRSLEFSVSDSHLARPVPSAACLPSVQDKFAAPENEIADMLNQNPLCSENQAISPTDSVVYSDRDFDTLWRSVESLTSRISCRSSWGEDNFFEFNSTGDPRGRAESQDSINRPDSGVIPDSGTIELACLASSKAEKLKENYSNVSSDLQPTEQLLRWSIAFKEVVKELARLISPLSSQPEYPEKQEIIPLKSSPAKETEEATVPYSLQQMIIPPSEYASRPVTSQEASPLLVQNIRHIAAAAEEARRPIPQAETDSVFNVPPPLPEKDAKYKAVSKNAARDVRRHFRTLRRRCTRRF
jgi:hypothetical protein